MKNLKQLHFLYNELCEKARAYKENGLIKNFFVPIMVIPFLMGSWSCAAKRNFEEQGVTYQSKKIIPNNILEEAKIALSHYPELDDVEIEFKYKGNIKNSFMQAQPKFANLFKGKKERSYIVLMSSKFLIENEEFSMADVPSEVLVGWLAHELGHIKDYLDKSALELVIFGARYVTSDNFIKKAERTADTHAINKGMGHYIFATKDFILNHSHLSDSYKRRKARLYLSPEAILVLVNEMEETLEIAEEEGS